MKIERKQEEMEGRGGWEDRGGIGEEGREGRGGERSVPVFSLVHFGGISS